jgi:hypothetical protein
VPNGQSTTGVDIIFGLALLGTLFLMLRHWRALWDADFTVEDRRLASQAAIFVVPPVVVLIHELGHYVAALMVGGHVLGFHYGLIEGAVTVDRGLSAGQFWWVALAGNLAGTATGLVLALVGAGAVGLPRALRRILILGGMLEVGFQLVVYPLISLSGRFGDWQVIYDFGATPGLSLLTAVAHVGALAVLWRWWRSHVRRVLFDVDHALAADVARLEAAMAASPLDTAPAIELAVLYAANGEMGLARETLEDAAAVPGLTGPPAARLHLVRARVAMFEDRYNDAYLAAQQGLQALGGGEGLEEGDELTQRLWANLGLALASMQRAGPALAAFDHLRPPVVDDPRILYTRGLARLAQGDQAGGEADLQAVVGWRPEGDLLRQWAEAKLLGRQPAPPDDRDRPNYARRTKAPPAPIAGV